MAEYIARKEANKWVADWLRADRNWHPYSKGKNIPTVEVFDILSRIPAADVQPVVHCKDCIRRPHYDPPDSDCNSDLEFPDGWNSLCPYYCEDNWYSEMPQDDWFCNFGKRTDGEA